MEKCDCDIAKHMPVGIDFCLEEGCSRHVFVLKGVISMYLDGTCHQGKGGSDSFLISSWLSATTERPSGAISTIDSTDAGIPITSQPGGPPLKRNSKPFASSFVRQGLLVGFRYMHRAG